MIARGLPWQQQAAGAGRQRRQQAGLSAGHCRHCCKHQQRMCVRWQGWECVQWALLRMQRQARSVSRGLAWSCVAAPASARGNSWFRAQCTQWPPQQAYTALARRAMPCLSNQEQQSSVECSQQRNMQSTTRTHAHSPRSHTRCLPRDCKGQLTEHSTRARTTTHIPHTGKRRADSATSGHARHTAAPAKGWHRALLVPS
jgi:hypothetical protein